MMYNIEKQSSPGKSQMLDYVVNIYKDGKFKVAYRYPGWSGTDVEDEVKTLRGRYPQSRGWSIDW